MKGYIRYDSMEGMLETAKEKLGHWYQGMWVEEGTGHKGA